MPTQLVEQGAIYFASVEISATSTCFLLNQDIKPKPKLKKSLEVCFLPLASLVQLESTKPCSINSPSPTYLRP